jgi:hypothetical protein
MYVARPDDPVEIQKEARAYRMEEYLREWLPPLALRGLNAIRRRLPK